MGLLDSLLSAYQSGMGLLAPNQKDVEMRPQIAKGLLGVLPGSGDAISGYDAMQSAREGNYGEAALNGVGLLPFIPSMGGILRRADLKPDGSHFGAWTLKDVEKRTRVEDVVDPVTGEAKAKRVADLENGEDSWGSGKRVANIYWMEHKGTGEIRPFGDDTAHYAMGVDSREAKKKFDKAWSLSQDKWLSDEAAKYGFQSFNQLDGRSVAYLGKDPRTGMMMPGKIANLREWLVTDKVTRDQAARRLAEYFGE